MVGKSSWLEVPMLENPSGHLQLETDKKDELWFSS